MVQRIEARSEVYLLDQMRDHSHLATAALVNRALSRDPGEGELRRGDIQTVKEMSAVKGALVKAGVSPYSVSGLAPQLDALDKWLDSERGQWALKKSFVPAVPRFEIFRPDALSSHAHRDCAIAVAECLGRKGETLPVGDFLKVKRLYDWHTAENQDQLPAPDQRLMPALEKLKERIESKKITGEMLNTINLIYNEDCVAAELFDHGPVSIDGRKMNGIYKLNMSSFKIKDPKDLDEVKAAILKNFERSGQSLEGCFYDRVYVMSEGELFLAISDAGSVTDGRMKIADNAPVTLRNNGTQDRQGLVVHRQEAVNTYREAIWKGIRDTQNLFNGTSDLQELEEAQMRRSKATKSDPQTAYKILGTVLTGAGVYSTAGLWGVPLAFLVGVGVTGHNVHKFRKARDDEFKMKPVFQAIGTGIGRVK